MAHAASEQRVSPELERHEKLFMQLRVVLDMYKKKQKSARARDKNDPKSGLASPNHTANLGRFCK